MVTSIIPISERKAPRAQAHAGGFGTYTRFDFGCIEAGPLSTVTISMQTPGTNDSGAGKPTDEYCRNHQFSITCISNNSGAISERYAYTAYGMPTICDASGTPLTIQTSSLSNRYTYTGREWDSTLGLHHFRARWMSGLAGRFLSRDPIGYEDSENQYTFLGNRALKFVDFSGNESELPDEAIGGWLPITGDCSYFDWSLSVTGTATKGIRPFSHSIPISVVKFGGGGPRRGCPAGTRCCDLLDLSIFYSANLVGTVTNVPTKKFGVLNADVDLTILANSHIIVGICVKNACPCPATIVKVININRGKITKKPPDVFKYPDFIPQPFRSYLPPSL
jgi:RHS repeat-associated protein